MDANVTVDYASYCSGKMSMHLGKEDYRTTIIIKSLLLPAETIKRKFAWVNIFIKFPSPNFRDNVHNFRFPCFFQDAGCIHVLM